MILMKMATIHYDSDFCNCFDLNASTTADYFQATFSELAATRHKTI
jgi:hypothetical protein